MNSMVSVPIRGLFNLTKTNSEKDLLKEQNASFRPH